MPWLVCFGYDINLSCNSSINIPTSDVGHILSDFNPGGFSNINVIRKETLELIYGILFLVPTYFFKCLQPQQSILHLECRTLENIWSLHAVISSQCSTHKRCGFGVVRQSIFPRTGLKPASIKASFSTPKTELYFYSKIDYLSLSLVYPSGGNA